jgi:hypothetical protein
MSTGSKFNRFNATLILCVLALCVGSLNATDTPPHSTTTHTKKTKKPQQPQLPPLPSGPTGRPVPQVPLDSIKPIAPQVSFQNGQLTIDAPNSTLGDILRAVKKQTGADIEIPDAQDRVVTHLGPGPARAVVAELLNGSKFNYVLLGSPEDANALTRIVLVAKSGSDNAGPNNPGPNNNNPTADNAGGPPRPRRAIAPPQEPEANDDANDDTSTADDNNNNNNNEQPQPAETAEQPANQGDQPTVKTPQQMLQEMQQRQMQFQQQQQNGGQPPTPGSGSPPQSQQN